MDQTILKKVLISVATVIVIQIVSYLFKRIAKKTHKNYNIRRSRYFAIKRILSTFFFILTLLFLILIWNVDVKNLWVSLTSVLALVAIAFFAVWSLVGNILAGVIVYFTSPFKVEDIIEIMPDEIRGTVLAINTFYTVLIDEENHYINIPNSLLFQRYIKVVKRGVKPTLCKE